MGCCSSDCGDSCGSGCSQDQDSYNYNMEVDQAAENLAVLIEQSPEYQEFVRLAQKIGRAHV